MYASAADSTAKKGSRQGAKNGRQHREQESRRRSSAQKRRRRHRRRLLRMALVYAMMVTVGGIAAGGTIVSVRWIMSVCAAAPKPIPEIPPAENVENDISIVSEETAEITEWNLVLVNPWNPVPDGFTVSLTQLRGGHAVDERCYPDLQSMMDDCRAAGLEPLICSSFRTQEKQESLFQNKVNFYLSQGYSTEKAQTEAGKVVAVPGTSEHQLGLAVDIVDINNQHLDESQEDTAVQKWLMENSWRYGFILRYPNDKSDITGIIYEPWHYRYIGKEAAREIYEQGVCLEEYLEGLQSASQDWRIEVQKPMAAGSP